MIDALASLNASSLASAMRRAEPTNLMPGVAETDQTGATFADFMTSMGTNFVNNIRDAEKTSMDGILGKASAREVVESVMTADQTLQTAMAFRDKIISAYLEVVKMPI